MQKFEFEALINKAVAPEDYKIIETVYRLHPALPDESEKARAAIAALYLIGGMTVMQDMCQRVLHFA